MRENVRRMRVEFESICVGGIIVVGGGVGESKMRSQDEAGA